MAAKTLKCDINFEHVDENLNDFSPSSEQESYLPATFEACSGDPFDKPVDILNIVDVYNVASSVGQEFERLTEAFGGAVFSGVMPKIIRVLEMLESLVTKKEKESGQIIELNAMLRKLEIDGNQRDSQWQEEIETIESVWKQKVKDLMEIVSTLKEDNHNLTALLTDKLQNEDDNKLKIQLEQKTLISKLQDQIEVQNDEMRLKNSIMEEHERESDALQLQIQRVTELNMGIRQKIYVLEEQGKLLIEQKVDLEAELNESKKQLSKLKVLPLPKEQNTDFLLDVKLRELNATETDHSFNEDTCLVNKLIIDLKDPNRPRYTLGELNGVLNDRNQLKARCFLLEEELKSYRRESRRDETNKHEVKESQNHVTQNQSNPAKSGILRFFNFLAGESSRGKGDATTTTKPSSSRSSENYSRLDETDERHLIDPDDIKQLIPQAYPKRTNATEETGNLVLK